MIIKVDLKINIYVKRRSFVNLQKSRSFFPRKVTNNNVLDYNKVTNLQKCSGLKLLVSFLVGICSIEHLRANQMG